MSHEADSSIDAKAHNPSLPWDAEQGLEGFALGAGASGQGGLYESSGSELSSPQALRLKPKVGQRCTAAQLLHEPFRRPLDCRLTAVVAEGAYFNGGAGRRRANAARL